MSSNRRNWFVFVAALLATAIATGVYLAGVGPGDDNIREALRFSAHTAFVVLASIFVARPLRQIWRTPFTLALLRNRRLLGIAFAGIHTAHLGLILYRDRVSADFSIEFPGSLPGALVYVMIYLLLLTSFDGPARALGPQNWRRLHKFGLYFIFIAFLPTLLPETQAQLFGPNGALVALAAAAIVVRLTVYLALRRRERVG